MSNKQPEALWLADDLETLRMNTATNDQAAAELRRLHAVNQALVEALTIFVQHFGDPFQCARAALAKAQGDQDGTR